MKITEEYKNQLQMMHTGKGGKKIGYGITPPEELVKLIKSYPITTALDFGCGQGNMIAVVLELFPHLTIQGYDPGVEQYSVFPKAVDLIYSADVLEHIEPHLIDETLKQLWNTGKYQYHNIACYPAKKTLPDGRNCHLIIEQPEWWINKIKFTIDRGQEITYTNTYRTPNKQGTQNTHLEIVIVK
jgi:hypothetical protein